MKPLPVDGRLPDIVEALRSDRNLVLVAEPGAGKTTRVPRALLDAGLTDEGQVLILEPRRLAARMAARRVAEELGETPGKTVGYQVRFDSVGGRNTRVMFVTEAILTRRLASDRQLPGVAAVVLDEFHERHLHGDLGLALLRALQRSERPDLRLLVMSATLDAEPVARFLDCKVIDVPGRSFEVAIGFLDQPDKRPLAAQVGSAVGRIAREGLEGDVLVFLPGASEIRRAREACAKAAQRYDFELAVLHGSLPPKEQDKAVRRSTRPKVILSTNVAESSITIDGVVTVIDSGLARVARHSPWSGLPTLETKPISRASATQRAGRAGRVRPGRCLRLYTRHDHDARAAHDAPEVRRSDLAETALLLRAMGHDPKAFVYFEAPPEAALGAAETLLERLGAVVDGKLAEHGRWAARLPLHPRLARVAIAAAEAGFTYEGANVAALLGERDLRARAQAGLGHPGGRMASRVDASDVLVRLGEFEAAVADGARGFARHGLDEGAGQAAQRAAAQIQRALEGLPIPVTNEAYERHEPEEALLRAILLGFPDRVARRRAPGSREVVLSGGGSGKLAPSSVVQDAPLLVAVEAEARRETLVRAASAIEPEWLLELFPSHVHDEEIVRFDAARERVTASQVLSYDGLVLDEVRRETPSGPEAARVLFEAANRAGMGAFCDADELEQLERRLSFAAQHDAALQGVAGAAVTDTLRDACEYASSFAELRDARLLDLVRANLVGPHRALLDRIAPERVALPRRPRGAIVHYEVDRAPWVESRLQDFFGLSETPHVADGRVPLTLHLLAPNRRAVQVTTDLAGFWQRHYPELRRSLMRRYPKHDWPEDPA